MSGSDPFANLEEAVTKQSAQEEALRALAQARCRLVLGKDAKSAFFATLALRLIPEVDWSLETMSTNGKKLIINPTFVKGLKPDELVGVVAHEVLHNALSHHTRRCHRDKERWNIACDLAVNPLLVDAGFTLPTSRLLPGQGKYQHLPPGKSAEEYYDLLLNPDKGSQQGQSQEEDDQADESQQGGNDNSGQSDQDGQDDQEDQNSPDAQDDQDQQQQGNSQGDQLQQDTTPSRQNQDPGRCGGVCDPGDGSPANVRQSEAEWEVAVAQAEQTARQRGELPGGLARLVTEILQPKVDWRDVLRQFLSTQARNDFSWSHPNRRFLHQGLYLPGLRSEELGEVVLAVDTSGSIGQSELSRFAAEAQAILESFEVSLIILYHDAAVLKVQRWRSGDGQLKLDPVGGGGTSHVCVFEHIEKLDEQPVCAVCLTDLYTDFPLKPPVIPTLWAVIGDNKFQPPFGLRVEVEP